MSVSTTDGGETGACTMVQAKPLLRNGLEPRSSVEEGAEGG